MRNKYGARRTYSALCEREFASKLEARRGEELKALEMYGAITDLRYQVKFVLNQKPRITISIDFVYNDENGKMIFEDTKGVLTRDFRTKLSWLKEKHNVDVLLSR